MTIKKVDEFRNLPVTSLLRVFSVVEDEDKERFVNVFRSYTISSGVKTNSFMFEFYHVEKDEFLDDISARFYGTPALWWIISDFNDIPNPFEALEEGMTLKVLRGDYLYTVFDDLQVIGDL